MFILICDKIYVDNFIKVDLHMEGAFYMGKDTIITIGRQCGSGGREIGIALSKELQIPYYDKELLKRAAKESGLCEEVFEKFDEKPTSSLLYSIVMDPYSLGINANGIDMPINHKVFLAAFDTIKKIADEGPCVMIGRCADYALADYNNVVNFFLYAPIEARTKRVSERMKLPPEKAKDYAIKIDKQRASYYNYYTTKKWGATVSYNFCLDTEVLGTEGTVTLMKSIVEQI